MSDDEFSALGELAEKSKVSKAWLGRHAISSLLEKANNGLEQLPLPLNAVQQKAA